MVYPGSRARESKGSRPVVESTIADKLRRHRNKERIWRRCVVKLEMQRAA